MISEPKLEQRDDQHIVGIRTQVPMTELPIVIPQLIQELFAWLEAHSLKLAGDPYARYLVFNADGKFDIEVGIPVANAVSGDDRVRADVIPAGQYAVMTHTGHYSGLMDATQSLLDWAKEQGLVWDSWDTETGTAFRARIEYYPTDPAVEPNPDKWETVLAFRLADEQVAEKV